MNVKLLSLKTIPHLKRNSAQVPVFFACDDAYVKFMMVAMTSLIAHASPDHEYMLHVLHTDITPEKQEQVMALARANIHISFHDVTSFIERIQSKLAIRDYYSSTTYYRVFIPDMFPQYDKALYIDSDTVVLKDIADLYSYCLGSNYIGAIQDTIVKNNDTFGNYVEKVLNISRAAYFNAGVVLLNCARMRKEQLQKQFIELLNAYTFVVAQDQDYLNIICKNQVLWIDSQWNVQMSENALRSPDQIALIHYNLAEKPWHYRDSRYGEYFWTYAKMAPSYEELKTILADFSSADRLQDQAFGAHLIDLAISEIHNEHNYRRRYEGNTKRALTRQEIMDKIQEYEREGRFDEDVEDDPPGRMLMPDEVDYLRTNFNNRMRTRHAFRIAHWFMNTMLRKKQLIIKDIVGIEHYKSLKSGAVITCNHFNAMDSFAMHIAYMKSGQRRRKLFRVIKEGNYTSFPGFYGFLMRNCNTLPLSSNVDTMKKFLQAVNKILQKGHFILIYPEQSMWWNYKKPKPLKKGAYTFAAQNHVPVLPCFVTMEDSNVPGEGGLPVQAYTIHIAPPIYPDPKKKKAENIQYMMEENARVWKEIYEETYGIPLTYSCDEAVEADTVS